ncbi:MAG: 30S ribosomal protein S6 [Planctomycetaceae bacterium]
MAENLYEGMFVLDSGHFASDPTGMATAVTDLLENAGGTIDVHRPWQDGRLAYEIAGRRKGLHYLAFFRMDPANLTALNRACRLSDKILRQMFIRQPVTLFDAMVAALSGETDEDEESAAEPTAEAKPETKD